MKKALFHGKALLNFSFLKSLFAVLLPEKIRFYFNWTIYPSATDKFFRELATKIIEKSKNLPVERPDFVSLMSRNIIPESNENQIEKGFTKEEIVAQCVLFLLAGTSTTKDVLQYVL